LPICFSTGNGSEFSHVKINPISICFKV
jgi:hypothetical protein